VIFATVGTHGDGFPRMLAALEQLETDELVVQYGHGTPPANAMRAEAFLPFDQMAELFEAADVVITHAGVGSILLASRAGHVPVIVPRLANLGEHVDDHQVELSRALESRGGVLVCWDASDLSKLVAEVPERRGPGTAEAGAIAKAVGASLRAARPDGERNGSARWRPRLPTTRPTADGRRGRLAALTSSTLGAYLGIGTDFQPQRAGTHVDPNGIAGYHCDFRHKASAEEEVAGGWLDAVLRGAPWWSPMMVTQAALGYYERHLDGEDTAERFLTLADWLLRYGEDGPLGLAWRHDYPVAKYGLTPGWHSGMTQGEGISVLLRAHLLSGEPRFRDGARAAFVPFQTETPDGGVVRTLDRELVVEEYPAAEPTAVLNGWIFGLLGLHELALVDDGTDVAETLARTLEGLLALLPRFDVGWWSCYSLGDHGRPDLAKPFYQRLHVVLLDALDAVSPDPRFQATARRWEAQVTPLAMARIGVDKIVFRATRAVRDR